jgi:hypothetical protein
MGTSTPTSRTGPVRQLKKSELTPAELKYGVAPVPDPSITYQPAVVMIGGGPDAIRARSSNGLTWTIDASAPHANEIAEGKIIFVTDLAVGRVLDVRRSDRDLLVTLGPALITDIIKDCNINPGPIPLDFDEAVPIDIPDSPGRVVPRNTADATPASDDGIVRVSFQQPATPPLGPGQDVSNLVNFKLVPSVRGKTGFGAKGVSDGGGLKMTLEALIHFNAPKLTPVLTIADGGVTEATLALSGAAGLTLKFEAGTDVGMRANVNGRVQAVPDFVFRLTGGTALTVHQQVIVKTALGVRNSTLGATADYGFDGAFKIGFRDKGFNLSAPVGFHAKYNLLNSLQGINIGPVGLDVIHEMKVMYGPAAGGFAAGPYFGFNSALGLFKGSDLGMIQCKEATFHLGMSGGIGYTIPKPVADVINAIFGALHINYKLETFAGIEAKPMSLLTRTDTLPGCKAGKE